MFQASSEPTDQRILDETIAQVRAHGARRTTVLSIAAALGMTHANVYRYFPSKAALFDAATARALAPLESALRDIADAPDPAPDKIERMAGAAHRAYRAFAVADPDLFARLADAVAAGRGIGRKHRAKVQAAIQRAVEEGVAGGAFPGTDARRAVAFVFDALHRFVHPVSVALDRDVADAPLAQRLERVTQAALRALTAGRV